jgi:DNA-binding MarR family transcriptional regulator
LLGFLETAATLEKRLDRVLSGGRGISFSEYRLLRGLAAAPQGTASRVDLATAVGLTPSAVTRALKPLEKLGVVTTERSARDARQSLASLTPAGAELFREAHGMLEDVLGASAARRFSPRQIETLRTCLADLGGKP